MTATLQSVTTSAVYRPRTIAGRGGLGHGAIAWLAAGSDFAMLLAASAAGFLLYEQISFSLSADPLGYIGIGLMVAMSFVLAMHSAHAYRPDAIVLRRYQIRLICLLIPGTFGFLLTVLFFLKLGATFSRGSIGASLLFSLAGLTGLRFLWPALLPYAMARGAFGRRRILLICSGTEPVAEFEERAAAHGMIVVEVLRLPQDEGLCQSAYDFARETTRKRIDEIILIWGEHDLTGLQGYLWQLRRSTLPVSVAFDGFIGTIVSAHSRPVGGLTVFQSQRPPLSLYESAIKRLFDVGFSATCLLALSPMMLAVALAIKLDSPGPVLFRQIRKGYGGRPFRIVKFRSMTVLEDGPEVRQATRGDHRITRVGAFIRSTSLDELPQFWNVLKGDMSVVGPRPHALAHDDYFDNQIGEYVFRRHVRPGLTGWAQINRCRGETPDVEKMQERVHHDLWYINNWSLWLDVKIILRTMFQLHDFRGAY
jgi:Undecaprenyl-phosphate glucose phosphotransferase